MTRPVIAAPADVKRAARWHEGKGHHRIFGGATPIGSCEAHFHDTYIIGYIRAGSAIALINGEALELGPGKVLLVNPFDIVECDSQPQFDYDVCYPDQAFMQQVLVANGGHGLITRFSRHLLEGKVALALGALIVELFLPDQARSPDLIEREICALLAAQQDLVVQARPQTDMPGFVVRACDLIEQHLERPMSVAELSVMVGRSRSDFARVFRDAMGLPPSTYIRQLRLARALLRIREGESLADVALLYGFFDQAHFTRAFKRVYGTAPGRLARDISRCRACG